VFQFDPELAEAVELDYYRFESFFRKAVEEIVIVEHRDYVFDMDRGHRQFFVSFYNMPLTERIRSMRSEKIGKLIALSGTVTRSTEVRPELFYGAFICKKCGQTQRGIEQQFQYTEPQACPTQGCTGNDYQLLFDDCVCVDWQRLRVQENADEIPPGNMPRCIDVICRNEIVETAKAGDKVIFTGCVVVVPDQSGSKVGDTAVSGKLTGRSESAIAKGVTGFKKMGVKELTYRLLFIACGIQLSDHKTGGPTGLPLQVDSNPNGDKDEASDVLGNKELTEAEMEIIIAMHRTPNLYHKMVDSVCPSIFGHSEVKRGILLMMLGGVHKRTKEGISLRGDINVCIVGDPSVAKSQFLKYVHTFLPRCVYTSGKSTTAAGLTATVVRDSATGEFCVEAGALMLADNGICCIDEFDKVCYSKFVVRFCSLFVIILLSHSDGFRRSGSYSRSHGTANHLHHEGWYSSYSQCSNIHSGGSQPNIWQI
jgi:DNA replication licensing factor MCM6